MAEDKLTDTARTRRRKRLVWGAFLAAALLAVAVNSSDWNWAGVWESRFFLLNGLVTSIWCALVAFAAGLLLGIALAVIRVYGPRALALPVALFVNLLQALPPLILLLGVYLVVPEITGLRLSGILAGLIGMSLVAAAYLAEVVRAGLHSVPAVQWESGRATGLKGWEILGFIVLPQAIRNMIPALLTIAVIIFKSTTLLYPLGVTDFFRAAALVNNRIIEPDLIYALVAAVYFFLCLLMSLVAQRLEPKDLRGQGQIGQLS